MSKLTDLAPSSRTVLVRGKSIDVPGIGAEGIASLITRFGDKTIVLAKALGGDSTAADLASLGPTMLAAFIAAGTGSPGDEAAEAMARGLGLQAQLDLVTAILQETMPGGTGPFADRFEEIAALLGPEMIEQLKAAAGPGLAKAFSPDPAQTPSQQPSTISSPPATKKEPSGV